MINPELLRSWEACWSDDEIERYFRHRRAHALTPRQIAEDTHLTCADRMWVLCQAIARLDIVAGRLFAIDNLRVRAQRLPAAQSELALGVLARLLEVEDLPVESQESAREAINDDIPNESSSCAIRLELWFAVVAHDIWTVVDAILMSTSAEQRPNKRTIARALEVLGPFADGWED